jgi:hypothetical protein
MHLRISSASPFAFALELIRPGAVAEVAHDKCPFHLRHHRRRDPSLAESEAARFQRDKFRHAQQVKTFGSVLCSVPVVLISADETHQARCSRPSAAQLLLPSTGTYARSNNAATSTEATAAYIRMVRAYSGTLTLVAPRDDRWFRSPREIRRYLVEQYLQFNLFEAPITRSSVVSVSWQICVEFSASGHEEAALGFG